MGIDASEIVALNEDLPVRDAAVDTLVASAGGKQTVIFVDNIHDLFDQMDQSEIRALRSIFQRTDVFSVIASASSLFPGVSDHDEPFYNFFRVFHLRELGVGEAKELMMKIARFDGNTAFIENFRDYEPGIEGLLRLVGGSPRLAIQLYETVSRAGIADTGAVFFGMVDGYTPYYREVFRRLPGQRRVIFDTLLSADTPLTPKDIAERSRLNLATVNAQLRRLEADGYVVSRPMKKRTAYEVRDRLFWLWRAMRRSTGRDRVVAVLEFLEAWREGSGVSGERDEAQVMRRSLALAREELLGGNEANGLRLIGAAYTHAERLDPGAVRRITAGFLKEVVGAGQVSTIKSAVRAIIASGSVGFAGFLKPVADAVEIVETNDTRLYYTRLQPEERAIVAGLVREITGSDELMPGI